MTSSFVFLIAHSTFFPCDSSVVQYGPCQSSSSSPMSSLAHLPLPPSLEATANSSACCWICADWNAPDASRSAAQWAQPRAAARWRADW